MKLATALAILMLGIAIGWLGYQVDHVTVPARAGVPADLPPWARDELVNARLRNADQERHLALCLTERALSDQRAEDLAVERALE